MLLNHLAAVLCYPAAGTVTTLAGGLMSGFVDATGATARFNAPWGLAYVPSLGGVVVGDHGNNVLRIVYMNGAVVTVSRAHACLQHAVRGPDHVEIAK